MKLYQVPLSPNCQKVVALQVPEAKDGRIRVIDHFMSASAHAAFFATGLLRTLGARTG